MNLFVGALGELVGLVKLEVGLFEHLWNEHESVLFKIKNIRGCLKLKLVSLQENLNVWILESKEFLKLIKIQFKKKEEYVYSNPSIYPKSLGLPQ